MSRISASFIFGPPFDGTRRVRGGLVVASERSLRWARPRAAAERRPRMSERSPVEAVVFDVGETIVDETREYGTWADWLGVPRHTFSAMFGAVIAQGRDYREVFQPFRPGFDLNTERDRRADVGQPESFGEDDLYPDTRPCLKALRDQGLLVGLAGNQTARAEGILRSLDLPVDMIGTSDGWGAEKPTAAFFE